MYSAVNPCARARSIIHPGKSSAVSGGSTEAKYGRRPVEYR